MSDKNTTIYAAKLKRKLTHNTLHTTTIMNSDTLVQKMMRMHLPPEDMFRKHTHLYSAFDDRGIPTHDATGNELHKSTIKKLSKDWDKQYKLYHTPLDE